MSDPQTPAEVISDTHLNDSPTDPSQPAPEGAGTTPQHPVNPSANPKSKGGPATHRPGCGCRPCSSRRRTEEALARRAGDDGEPSTLPAKVEAPKLEAELSDLPAIPISRMKQNVAKWLTMKTADPDLTNKEIAEQLGIALRTLNNTLYKARKEGWLQFHDPLDELKYGMIPKVVDNLNLFLDARDRTVTLEAAKATLFREFANKEGIADAPPTTILALKIELPEGYSRENLPKPKGVIVARPNFVDAEVVKVESDS